MGPLPALIGFALVLSSACISSKDRDVIERFYQSRTGEDLQWNKAEKAAKSQNGFLLDPFLCPEARKSLLKDSKPLVRCSSYPPYEPGLAECKTYPHSTGDCFMQVDTHVSYVCECRDGWQCRSCNVTTLPCANITMYCDENHYADCLTSTDTCELPACSCKQGWSTDLNVVKNGGLQCQTDVDECLNNPCENSGICENTKGSYVCKCTDKWAGPNCEYVKRCTDGQNLNFCGPNAHCVDGVTGDDFVYGTCKCDLGKAGNPLTGCGLVSWKTASASGDPHIYPFDGPTPQRSSIDYMGTRPFTFARPNWNHQDKPFVPYFKVVVVSSKRISGANSPVSYVEDVYVDIRNATSQHRVHFSAPSNGRFDLDGQVHWPPYTELEELFTVGATDTANFQLNTDFGLQVNVVGTTLNVYVLAGSKYDGQMYGLAGNMNGNPNDDSSDGDQYTYENNNEGYSGSGGQLQSDLPHVQQSDADWAKIHSKCRFLVQENSPFDLCRQFLNETLMHNAFEDCAVDVGQMRTSPHFDDNTCEGLLFPVAHQCRNAAFQKLGVDTWKWRDATGCPPPPCGDHSFFNENSPMCLNSCTEPNAQALCHVQELQEICMCEQSDSIKYVLSVSGPERCVRYPDGCPRPHKGITMELEEESVNLKCNQNCLFVSQDANIVCKPMVCQPNSKCTVRDGIRDCLCDEGHVGDGRVECRVPKRNCADLQKYFSIQQSGVPDVTIWGPSGERKALCDMNTDGGGWITVQKRVGSTTGFVRPWTDYVTGFGDSFAADFWYGLEAMHIMTNYSAQGVTLRIELTGCDDKMVFQEYENVKVDSADNSYRLRFGKSQGSAGDALQSLDPDSNSANGMKFSTADRDNDLMSGLNCASLFSGGWWFRQCSTSNLNGKFYASCGGQGQIDTIQWLSDPQQLPHSYKIVEIKMRPTVYPPTD